MSSKGAPLTYREAGVDIVLNAPAQEIIVERGRAVGVVGRGADERGQQLPYDDLRHFFVFPFLMFLLANG